MAGATSGPSKASTVDMTPDPSHYIEYHLHSDVLSKPDRAKVASTATPETTPKYDSLTVDVVAIYAGDETVFKYREQPQPSKPAMSNPSDQDSLQASSNMLQKVTGNAFKTPLANGNWLIDQNMLRSHLPVARIMGFCLDLKSLDDSMKSADSKIRLKPFAEWIGGKLEVERTVNAEKNGDKLQQSKKVYDSRSIVFIGHGYGNLLIHKLLTECRFTEHLKEYTSAIGCFGPAGARSLTRWASRFLKINEDASFALKLEVDTCDLEWLLFMKHKPSWNGLIFAFLEKESDAEKQKKDGKGKKDKSNKKEELPSDQQDQQVHTTRPDAAAAVSSPHAQPDKIWDMEDYMSKIENITGPQDPEFRKMTDYLIKAIHPHQWLVSAKRNDIQMIELLDKKSFDINVVNKADQTLLHVAVENKSTAVMSFLIATGKVRLDHQDASGMTALHVATQGNTGLGPTIVKELLEAGANPTISNGKSLTPAELANQELNAILSEQEREKSPLRPIIDLLENPPPVLPRRIERLVKDGFVEESDAHLACRNTPAEVRDIFKTDRYTQYYTTVERLIYDSSAAKTRLSDIRSPEKPGQVGAETMTSADKYLDAQIEAHAKRGYTSLKNQKICRWYHIPVNNMAWVHDLFATLECHVWPWPQGYRSFTLPYSRAVYPQVTQLKPFDENIKTSELQVWALMMPYISYEERGRQTAMTRLIQATQNADIDQYEYMIKTVKRLYYQLHRCVGDRFANDWYWRLSGVRSSLWRKISDAMANHGDKNGSHSGGSSGIRGANSEIVKAYLNYRHTSDYERDMPLHPRRTLDQSYYYMLDNTSFRDKTQVVSRWRTKEKSSVSKRDESRGHNILMVDQLWLWVIKRSGHPDTIITSFPGREGSNPSEVDDLERQILHGGSRDAFRCTGDVVAQILAVCSRTLIPNQSYESVRFLQCFERAVADVEEKASLLLLDFRILSAVLQELNDNKPPHPRHPKRLRILLNKLFDISRELKPLAEVKDILDEIKIIQTTLEDQKTVMYSNELSELAKVLDDPTEPDCFRKPKDILASVIRNIEVVQARAEAVEKSVRTIRDNESALQIDLDKIEHLLDLKQKQANLWEARTSRESADENAKQGKTLLVFTVVTIIFAPLSFIAAFLAIDIDNFPKDADGNTTWPHRTAYRYVFGISGAIAIPLILIAFLVEHCHRGLIHFFHFYLKIVALALLRLLTRIPVLGHMFRTRWDSIADSASEYRRNYEQHVNELLSKDKTDSDDEFHNTLNKRVRWLEKMGKVSSLLEGLEGSDDDEMDGDGDSL